MNFRGPDFRPALAIEGDDVANLLFEAFARYRQQYTAAAFAETISTRAGIAHRIEEGHVWVAVLDGVLVGTLSAMPDGKAFYLFSIAVLPRARGCGIASWMLREIEAMAASSGYRRLLLYTTPFLAEAIRLYERSGFTRADEEDDLFGTPIFSMEKRLNPDS